MRNFRQLKVWQHGIDIVKAVYEASKQLPVEEKYGITSKVNKAAVSIPTHIAEGSSRTSQKEFRYYLQLSLGAAYEVETLLVVIEQSKLIENTHVQLIKDLVVREQKMLHRLIKSPTSQ